MIKYAFILFVSVCALGMESKWGCGEAHWVNPPQLEDGLFEATIAGRCQVKGADSKSISLLADFLKSDIPNSDRLLIHSGPTTVIVNGMAGFEFDATDDMKSEGSPASLRQKIYWVMNPGKDHLIYSTKSKKVTGSGRASYLRRVDLLADVHFDKESGEGEIYFENTINVERPWFAIGFLFKAIATSTTEEKFRLAQEKLLSYLVPHIVVN